MVRAPWPGDGGSGSTRAQGRSGRRKGPQCCASIFPDILLIAGKYQVKPPLPFSPGLEVAGTIHSLGKGVTGFTPGQRVLAQLSMGGFAEFAAAPVEAIQPIPDTMTDDEAAAFPLVYQTSYFALVVRGSLQKGETVLVHSAAGGVGLAAVQIARALGAGKIIGTAGSDHKMDSFAEMAPTSPSITRRQISSRSSSVKPMATART